MVSPKGFIFNEEINTISELNINWVIQHKFEGQTSLFHYGKEWQKIVSQKLTVANKFCIKNESSRHYHSKLSVEKYVYINLKALLANKHYFYLVLLLKSYLKSQCEVKLFLDIFLSGRLQRKKLSHSHFSKTLQQT